MSDFNHATASCPGVSSSNSSHLPIQFHQWYPIYRKQSIKSLVIELPQSFISYIQDEDSIHLPPDVISAATGDHFSDDEDLHEVDEEEGTTAAPSSSLFHHLNNQLRRAIQDLNGAVFIKMNWKAPKDASWINANTLKCLNLEQVYLLLKASSRVTDVIEIIREHESQIQDNSNSENITDGDKNPLSYSLILRKWSNLHPSMEFRCFVGERKPLGASQRDCSCPYDFLLRDKNDIEDTLYDFITNTILDVNRCPFDSFVCDVYVDKNNKCWIIDFNNFSDDTDSLLFEWNQLRDMANSCSDAECERNFELKLVETSDQIIPNDAGVSRGPIDAIEVASGNVEAFGNWRNAMRNDMARGESSESDSDHEQ